MIDREIQEQLRNKYNPDGSELRNLQLRMLRMLEYFDEFCKKNKITYWLSSGTCLGAVRHNGFIPWDDDLDIEMLPEDFEKLVALRKNFDNSNYIIQDYHSDREYITPFAKIRDLHSEIKEVHDRDKYFKYKGVFIDIFLRKKGSFMTMKLSHIAQYASYTLTDIKYAHARKIAKSILYFGLHNFLFPLLNLLDTIFVNNSMLSYGLGYGFYIQIDSNGLFPLKKMEFEGIQFPVPGNYGDYLYRIYGDYEKLPDNNNNHRIHFKSIKLF